LSWTSKSRVMAFTANYLRNLSSANV
jgi:hypothetical protein